MVPFFLTWWSKCEILHILDPFLLCALLTIEVLSEFICPKKNVTFGPNALCDNYTCLVFIILLTKLLWHSPFNLNLGCEVSGTVEKNGILYIESRWVSVVEFHDRALSIGKIFGQESTVVKWNYQILGCHQVTVCQKPCLCWVPDHEIPLPKLI